MNGKHHSFEDNIYIYSNTTKSNSKITKSGKYEFFRKLQLSSSGVRLVMKENANS